MYGIFLLGRLATLAHVTAMGCFPPETTMEIFTPSIFGYIFLFPSATPVCGLRWDRRSERFLRSCRLHFQNDVEIVAWGAEGGWWALSASQDCMPSFSWPLWGWGREPGTHLLGVVCWPGEHFAQARRSPQWRATVAHNERDRVHFIPPLNFMLSLQTACAFI